MANRTDEDVVRRVRSTLALMHRWGYAPSVEVLARQLLGGSVELGELRAILDRRPDLTLRDDFVCLRGSEPLLGRSKERIGMNRRHAEDAWGIARDYARDFVRACPFVECVALSGSLASGGYGPHDDIDFDLIVQPGSKYTTYLLAHLVGLKYGWRYRDRRLDDLHHTPFLPKIACINVVWTEDQMRPFERRDENMAFELMRAIPLYGVRRFEDALGDNPWLRDFFPQTYGRVWPEEPRERRSWVGRVLEGVQRNPRMAAFLERVSRGVAWRLYRGVQGSRVRNPVAVARMEFLRRAKYPYEVFQD